MRPFAFNQWHAWKGAAQILLSDEDNKILRQFDTTDECINWLHLNGQAPAARALHQHVKGTK